MSRLGRAVSLFACCVFALTSAACAGPRAGGRNVDVAGDWQLASGELNGEPVPIVPGYRITLQIEGRDAGGRSACNWYGGSIRRRGSSLSFGEISGTLIGCQGSVADSEETYLSALQVVDTAKREGEVLLLSGPDTVLRFGPVTPVPREALVDRVWVLEAMLTDGNSSSVEGEEATLELRADGTVAGSTGCRTLTGTYVVDADEILFTELGADGECPTELEEQDGHVVGVLGDGFTVAIDGDVLTVTSTGNLGLVYRST